MKRSEYKKYDELAAWELDKGCRHIIDQSTPANRRLKKKLRKQARTKLKAIYESFSYDDFPENANEF